MANFSGLFQAEITRLSKKAIRQETAPLKAQIQKLRAEATTTKHALLYLKRELDRLQKELATTRPIATVKAAPANRRYSTKMLVGFAKKHNLSGPQVAKLLGSTPASAYSWLKGLRPRQRYVDAFNAIKELSKAEIAHRLAQ